jgi:hypothetical protein
LQGLDYCNTHVTIQQHSLEHQCARDSLCAAELCNTDTSNCNTCMVKGAGFFAGAALLQLVGFRGTLLALAPAFLLASREVWFVVALPVFLSCVLGWSYMQVGAFMATWIIA